MAERRVVLMVVMMIWLNLFSEICYSSKELEDHANEIKPQSWTDWASHKLNKGLGRIKLDSQKRKFEQDVIGRVGKGAMETVNSAKLDGSNHESISKGRDGTVSEAKKRINLVTSEATGNNNSTTTTTTTDYGSRERIGSEGILDYGRDSASSSSVRVASEGCDHGQTKGSARGNYEQAKRKVGEFKDLTKETTSKKTKSAYEAAKENLSQATGDLGAKLEDYSGEL